MLHILHMAKRVEHLANSFTVRRPFLSITMVALNIAFNVSFILSTQFLHNKNFLCYQLTKTSDHKSVNWCCTGLTILSMIRFFSLHTIVVVIKVTSCNILIMALPPPGDLQIILHWIFWFI